MKLLAFLQNTIDYLHQFKPFTLETGHITGINNYIFIDLASDNNHLGDLLFFGPLILRLLNDNRLAGVEDPFDFYKSILRIKSSEIPQFIIYRSKLGVENSYSKLPNFRVNFYNSSPLPISQYIYNLVYDDRYHEFTRAFSDCILYSKDHQFSKHIENFGEYVIFSPYINSRKFGFFPSSKSVLTEMFYKVNEYRSLGLKIILVGSLSSCANHLPEFYLDYVDIDLRGMTSITQLISLISDKKCHSIITYDTFTYHLSYLLGAHIDLYKKSWLSPQELSWISKRYYPAFIL